MVARNFTVQDLPYSRLLQLPDDDRDFLTEELKPTAVHNIPAPQHNYQPIYYELSNMVEHPCSSTVYQPNQTALDSPNSNFKELHHVESSVSKSRKRKTSCHDGSDIEDDLLEDSKSIKNTDDNKKQNHSEIEKRRRDKMNTYITELSSMVPMCNAISRKLDKLTVLRMAVQHIKTIRGAVHSYTEGHYKPSFLSDQELKHLILQAADGFLFVVGCDRGRILHVSESVSKSLNYAQNDLMGQSLFDILHPKDLAKVKEQLSSSDLNPRERLIDAKTMLPVKTDVPQGSSRLCPGARRSFFCRMKCKISSQIKEEADTTTGCHTRKNKQNSDKKYNVIQCTGYLKSWASTKNGLEDQESEGDSCNLSCLVAIGRVLPHINSVTASIMPTPTVRPIQFVSRHALDGKFLFVDQTATLVLGFLPQELLGTSMYEYYHHDDVHFIAEHHKHALESLDRVTTKIYRFKTKDGAYIKLRSEWKSFKNPWTKEIECMIAKNNLILSDFRTVESTGERSEGIQENFDFFPQSNDMQRIINNHIEASNIGRQIAEQVMDSHKIREDLTMENSPTVSNSESSMSMLNAESSISTTISTETLISSNVTQLMQGYSQSQPQYTHLRDNSMQQLSNDSGGGMSVTVSDPEDKIIGLMEDVVKETPANAPSTDGNDEAAMAVIMSLLEADAGLGGPVDFSGLPWPLP